VLRSLDEFGAEVIDLDYEKDVAAKQLSMHFEIRFPVTTGVHALVDRLEREEGVARVQVHVRSRR